MLSLKSITEGHDRLMVRPSGRSLRGSHLSRPNLPLLSLRLQVFHPTTRIHVRLLGPCFKTGLMRTFILWIQELQKDNEQFTHTQSKGTSEEVPTNWCNMSHPHRLGKCRNPSFLRQASVFTLWNVIHRSENYQDTALSHSPNASRGPSQHSAPNSASKRIPVGLTLTNSTRLQQIQAKMSTVRDTAPIRFPFNGFTHFFTLSSEFFSSFPHGTCSLSVSCQYLALDEVYHPLRTALSSNPTQWKGMTKGRFGNQERGSHPLWQLIPKHLGHRLPARSLFRLQSGAP